MKLHKCAKVGNLAGVQQELNCGIAVDTPDSDADPQFHPTTALEQALISPEAGVEMVEFLLEQGAHLTLVPTHEPVRYPAMVWAIRSGDRAKVALLLARGATLDYPLDGPYDDALAAAMGSKAFQGLAQGEARQAFLQFILEQGPALDPNQDYGRLALWQAAGLGWFAEVRQLMAAGASLEPLAWTPLLQAIALGSLAEVEDCLAQAPDVSVRDRFDRTPWLLSVQTGDVAKAQQLLEAGSDPLAMDQQQKFALLFAIDSGCLEMVDWLLELDLSGQGGETYPLPQRPLLGYDLEQEDTFGKTALLAAVEQDWLVAAEHLLQAGSDPLRVHKYNTLAIQEAQSLEMAELLVAYGEDFSNLNSTVRRQLTRVSEPTDWMTTVDEYWRDRFPRFGQKNPEVMAVPFWREMVRRRDWAYGARLQFEDTEWQRQEAIASANYAGGAIWCFGRFGQSLTRLPDGQIVEIAGQHEDFYDPDFCIYNDVVVYDGQGNFQIYGYPKAIFPPTDYHTATLVGDTIYVIGNLGYSSDRHFGQTPVFRLDCNTWQIDSVETTGEQPGWISSHRASLQYSEAGDPMIRVWGGKIYQLIDQEPQYLDHVGIYLLDLRRSVWQRLSAETISAGPD